MVVRRAVPEFRPGIQTGFVVIFLGIFGIISSRMMCRDAARNHCADEFDGRNDYDLGSRFSGFRSFLEFHSPPLGT